MSQADRQELQRAEHIDQMQQVFAENMDAFKHYMKPIYNFYLDYQPSAVFIDMDINGHLNLKQNDAPIYPGDPKTAHKLQFERFKESPRHFRFKPIINNPGPVKKGHFAHSYFLAKIDELGQAALEQDRDPNPTFMPTLLLLGIGMGYHLEMLHDHYDIRNLLLYEPNPDVFYAAMFLIRFTPLLKHFTTGTNSITIKIDGLPGEFCNEVSKLSLERGTFNVCKIYLYRHYNSTATDDTFSQLHHIAHRLMQGWGFFEDELISLNHSAINCKKPMSLIRNDRKNMPPQALPAFIIANGPSLDADLAYIKAHRDSAIIFSAGSTIFTLYQAGITPDYHVDIERTWGPTTSSRKVPQEFREKVTLLTLNTTLFTMLELYPKHAFCLKANDTGTHLLSDQIPADFDNALIHCNPLAGNGALAFALRLGFKDLVFFGLDMGSVDGNQHHASSSLYYKKDHPFYNPKKRDDFKLQRPCNRGGTMHTSELLDFSRYAVEVAIHSFTGIRAQNCSIGLEITGCTAVNSQDLEFENKPEAKTQLIDKIESELFRTFEHEDSQIDDNLNALRDQIFDLSQRLLQCFNPLPTTIKGTLDCFAEQLKILEDLQETQVIPTRMWLGTCRYLHCNIATWLINLREDSDTTQKYITDSLKVATDYIHTVMELYDRYEGRQWGVVSAQEILDETGR